ncbi:hypothetical protein ACF07D_04665 [Leucobacter sp. NPDC015123]|uniref:hypothetical protein n=1 Tax=Leucobacter sp. NPDC015123 TaxID=3364129 RepID=UPI0036F48F2D
MLRYIVERISDGKFLELELPITVSGAGRKLGGAGSFSGEIAPIFDVYKYAGSDALIDPLATYIHEDADGVIRGSWIVTRTEFEGAIWRIEGQGFSSFFSGRPYEGEYRGVKVDPIAVARHVAEHAQNMTSADIGVKVVGSSSLRVGTDSDTQLAAAEAVLKEAKRARTENTKARTSKTKTKQALTKSHEVSRCDYQSIAGDIEGSSRGVAGAPEGEGTGRTDRCSADGPQQRGTGREDCAGREEGRPQACQ